MHRGRRVAVVASATAGLGLGIWWCAESFGWRSPVFGALANWCVVVYVAVTSVAVRWRLPSGFYRLREWERGGTIYSRWGVGVVGTLVRRTPGRLLSPTLYLHSRRDRLACVRAGTCDAEAAHWWAALLAVLLAGYAVARGLPASGAWLLFFNLVFNAYPALFQRLTRGRLDRALSRALPDTRQHPTGAQHCSEGR